jgi:hypothetical protein
VIIKLFVQTKVIGGRKILNLILHTNNPEGNDVPRFVVPLAAAAAAARTRSCLQLVRG